MSWRINQIEVKNFKFFKNTFTLNIDRKTSCFMEKMEQEKVLFIGVCLLIFKLMQKNKQKLRNILPQIIPKI